MRANIITNGTKTEKTGIAAKIGAAILLTGGLLAGGAQSAHAYDNDTHYTFTYYLARKVGYNVRQAWQIASADISVDIDPDTEPLQLAQAALPWGDAQTPRVRFHALPDSRIYDTVFNDAYNHSSWYYWFFGGGREAAQKKATDTAYADSRDKMNYLWQRGLQTGNPGAFLHFAQDTYAHAGYWSFAGHAGNGHLPDFLSADPNKAKNMALFTIARLGDFMVQYLHRKPNFVSNSDIDSMLSQLIRANPAPGPVAKFYTSPDESKARPLVSQMLGEPVYNWYVYNYDGHGNTNDSNWTLR